MSSKHEALHDTILSIPIFTYYSIRYRYTYIYMFVYIEKTRKRVNSL